MLGIHTDMRSKEFLEQEEPTEIWDEVPPILKQNKKDVLPHPKVAPSFQQPGAGFKPRERRRPPALSRKRKKSYRMDGKDTCTQRTKNIQHGQKRKKYDKNAKIN